VQSEDEDMEMGPSSEAKKETFVREDKKTSPEEDALKV
jgi:hypothetical protein